MKKKNDEETVEEKTDTKAYLITAIVAGVLAAVSFGLAFTALGIYALIAAILLSLAALSFVTTQQKKNPLPACKAVKIIIYAELIILAAFFVGGTIYALVSE